MVTDAIPEDVENFRLTPQAGCHPDVPGWWGRGETTMSIAELAAWYTNRFGPLNQSLTHRITAARQAQFGVDRPLLIFEGMRVMVTPGPTGRIRVDVRSYEAVGHDCPLRDAKLWYINPVTAYEETSTCLDFLGV